MSYQVLARKWRPQRFDEVVGQLGVTQTLRNAITGDRLAHAFVFAGPRGVGKTTTARILARALNCVQGPTPDPCGVCDACTEIAGGRDIDVLEIDAATHTQVENVREVIIAGLAMAPVRDRYKIFLIDEVHQLSSHSFNALLKSIEEPPPHVVFMMATTELGKIPETIRSRSQVFEFKTIATRAIADQLHAIATKEGIAIDDTAVALLARSAEGSMRDAQSAFDQVIAFAGETITADDVSTVLGIVGRDLLLDVLEAVAAEQGPALFELAARAVEAGYDLRMVCRELSRLNRDLLLVSLDPARIDDPEIAGEGDRERVRALAQRFSREDLMRAFDVLAHAEAEIRTASQPRYHLEMALIRWMHLRKLVPLVELIDRLQSGGPIGTPGVARSLAPAPPRPGSRPAARPPSRPAGEPEARSDSRRPSPPAARHDSRPEARAAARPVRSAEAPPRAATAAQPAASATQSPTPPARARREAPAAPAPAEPPPDRRGAAPSGDPDGDGTAALKDALLNEIKSSKKLLYGTVIAQAEKIAVTSDRVTFTFASTHRTLRMQLDRNRAWIAGVAEKLAGRKIKVEAVESAAAAAGPVEAQTQPDAAEPTDPKAALKSEAMEDAGVQAMLDVFAADIREVEEI